jgi:radical SAM superfamily enzyme YgiQ (UPF0313 family)
MKTLFIIRDIQMIERMGIMLLSSLLKSHGHEAELIQANYEDVGKKINNFGPGLLAYSSTTGEHKHALQLNRELKRKFDFVSVFGGPHPTFFPEMIEEEGVDIVCRGEGEGAMVELAEAIDSGKAIDSIKNLWIKKDGVIIKNPVRDLVFELDSLPFPDRDIIYKNDPILKRHGEKRLLIGRGCPYNCSYCFNHKLKELYGHPWTKIRRRSAGNVIEEIEEIKKGYPLQFIRFIDDNFLFCKDEWLEEFQRLYRRRVNIPFLCNIRPNLVTPAKIKILKEAGCRSVFMGIETADDDLRYRLLQRRISRPQIQKTCNWLREEGIRFGFYNVLGLPVKEPLIKDWETLRLNIKYRPDIAWSSLFYPYPRTELAEYAVREGFFDRDFNRMPANNKISSCLRFTSLKEKRRVENLQKLFGLTVAFPFLIPLTRQLIKLPPNRVFNFILFAWAGICFKLRLARIRFSPARLFDLVKALPRFLKEE